MTVLELLRKLQERGVRLAARDDQLVLRAPKGAMTEELAEAVRSAKAELLEVLRDAGAPKVDAVESLEGLADGDQPPLAPAQKRIWALQQMDPDSTIYNHPGGFRLQGPLDRGALIKALQAVVDRHAVLRSRFLDADGRPRLEIADHVTVELPVTDLQSVDEPDREAAMRDFLETRADRPLDLEAGPPFHVELAQLGPEDHALLFVGHALVWDGWSFDRLLHEMKAHYEAALAGRDDALPPLPAQFTDFAEWQRRRLERGDLQPHLDYWRKKLAGPIPSIDLPTDRPRSSASDYKGARQWFRLDGDVLDGVRALARRESATTYTIFLAALNVLIHRYSGAEDIVVATPLQCRTHPAVEDMIGVFVNTLFIRGDIDPDASFRSLLRQLRTTCWEAVDHQEAPSEIVVEQMEEDGLDHAPYEVIFVFQQTASRPTRMGPVQVQSIARGTRKVAVDLVVWAREYDDYVDGGFDYRTSLFDDSRMVRMVQQLSRLIASAVANPDLPIGDLDLLGTDEAEALQAWGELSAGADSSSRAPLDIGALIIDGQQRSAEEARRDVDRMAVCLRDKLGSPGAARGKVVALRMDGSAESIAALVAAAEAEMDTLLLHPGLPTGHLQRHAEAAGAELLLAGGSDLERELTGVTVVDVPDGADEPSAQPASRASYAGEVLIPVPGGAGGVRLAKRSWDAFFEDVTVLRDELGLTEASGLAIFPDGAPEHAALAILAAADAGARLVTPATGAPPDGWELDESVREGTVEALVAGSRALGDLLATGWESTIDIVLATDPFLPATIEAQVRDQSQRFARAWGCAEAGSLALLGYEGIEQQGLGRPTGSTKVRVVDARLRPVPVGVRGELLVGGPAVGGGYRNDPGATESRFVEDPQDAAQLVFRTGEQVRWSEDGRLVHCGRLDREWTLDGPRIDLAAVEDAIRRHPAVEDAHAAIRPVDGELHLVGYVVAGTEDQDDEGLLRTHLAGELAPWSVPARLIGVPSLPRTASGAVDERRLLAMTRDESDGYVAPRTEEERALAAIWQEVLNVDRVGVHDNFFELGGHSLLAVQASRTLEERLGLRIDPRALYFHNLEQVARGANGKATAAATVAGETP